MKFVPSAILFLSTCGFASAGQSVPDVTLEGLNAVANIENAFSSLPGAGVWCATSAPLMGNGDMGVCLLGQPASLQFMLGKNDFWHLKLTHPGTTALNFGHLALSIPALKGATFNLTQHLADATTSGTFTLPDGHGVTIKTYVAASSNVLVVQLAASGEAFESNAELAAGKYHFQEEASAGSGQGLSWVTRAFTKEVDLATNASAVLKMVGASGPKFTLEPGKPVTLLVAMSSNFEGGDPLVKAKQLAQAADAAKLLESHKAWWTRFWNQSYVKMGDAEIMRRYYTAQYVMAAASRNPKFPPGIIGPWITSGDNIFAAGAYWMNYNHAAPFYGLYSSNHLEQADPEDAPILDFMSRGAQYAKDILHIRGLLYPVGIGPLGFDVNYKTQTYKAPNLEGGTALTWGQRSDAAYNLLNMTQRWRTTYDPAYGKKIYPFVRGVVDFWEDYLKLEDDRYVINNDSVQEGTGDNKNPVNSLGLVRSAFRLALDLSQELGVDQTRQAKWRDILKRLSNYPTQEKNGKTIFILSEKGPVTWVNNTVNIQHIYPAGQIGLDSDPKLLQTARDTLEAAPRWHDQNGSNSFLPMAARIGYNPKVILDKLHHYPMGANGLFAGNPHGIENCSTVPNTINEMLMQSHEGLLRFFPCWPKDQPASFDSLRACGAFLVSADLKDGQIGGVRITSERGRDCVISNPWPDKQVQVLRAGKPAEILKGERFTLKSKAGEILELKMEGMPGAGLR